MAIRFEGVSKTFRSLFGRARVDALVDLDLEIPRGTIFGLLGPNGSGKTTSLSLLLGLLRPTRGRISVFDKPPGHIDMRRSIGYLPEEFAPPELLRGEEVLAYYGGFHSMERGELRRRIDRYLDLLDLTAARRRRFREYSKGMQRRIGLAQALLHDPEILVLDEPTNGLDPLGVRRVKTLLLDLRARGRTILICSHVLPELEEICDHLAILHRGRLVCAGATSDLLRAPDRFEIVLDGIDAEGARAAADRIALDGVRCVEVRPVRRTLEELFLERVAAAGLGAPVDDSAAPGAETARPRGED